MPNEIETLREARKASMDGFKNNLHELFGMLDQHIDVESAKQLKEANAEPLRILLHAGVNTNLLQVHIDFVQAHIRLGKLLFDANSEIPRNELWEDALVIWKHSSGSISTLTYESKNFGLDPEDLTPRIHLLNNIERMLTDPKNPENTTNVLVTNENSRSRLEGSPLRRHLEKLKWPIPLMYSILAIVTIAIFAACMTVMLTTPAAFGAALMAAIFVPTFLVVFGGMLGIPFISGTRLGKSSNYGPASKTLAELVEGMAKKANPEAYDQYQNSTPPIKFLGITLKSAKSKNAPSGLGTHAKLWQTIVTDAPASSTQQNNETAIPPNKPADTQNPDQTPAEQDHTHKNKPT